MKSTCALVYFYGSWCVFNVVELFEMSFHMVWNMLSGVSGLSGVVWCGSMNTLSGVVWSVSTNTQF